MPRAAPGQASLFDWTPPAATTAFEPERVRAATIAGRISRAVSAVLGDCGLPRADVVKRMSAYLGEPFSKAMLDTYASQGREDHHLPVHRLIALLHVTRDRRLLEMIAEEFGWAVIERRHLPLIELAALQERQEELRQHANALRREAKARGGL